MGSQNFQTISASYKTRKTYFSGGAGKWPLQNYMSIFHGWTFFYTTCENMQCLHLLHQSVTMSYISDELFTICESIFWNPRLQAALSILFLDVKPYNVV
jgi:hypothetical protein